MEEKVIGLRFIPDKRFLEMFSGLQQLVSKKYKGVFFLDASQETIKKMKYSSYAGSNKLNGWIIPKERAEEFDILFCQNGNLSDWDSYRKSVWAWNDTDKHQGWLYSFNGAVFGENVIE